MILASNVLYLLWNFKEAVKQLRSLEKKNSSRSPLTTCALSESFFHLNIKHCSFAPYFLLKHFKIAFNKTLSHLKARV